MADYKKGPFGSALKKDIFVPKSINSIKVYEQQNAIEKDWRLERYFITKEYSDKLSGFYVEPGDVIVSCAGTIGEIYELPSDAEHGVINQALMRVRVHCDVDKNWFLYAFSNMISAFSAKYSNGSAIKNIPPFADLKRYQLFLPAIDEQRKVGCFLSLLDKRIDVQNKIIEESRFLIDALCSQVKPSQTFCLQDICECKTSVLKESEIASEGLYPVYGATGRCGYLDKPLFNQPGVAVVKDGAGVGRCFQIKDKGFSTLGTMALLIPKKGVPLEYLWVAVKSISFVKYIVGSGIPHVYFKDYKAALVPAITSQALTLSKLCESLFLKMEIESKKLDQLSKEKAYLLCNLFI